MKNLILKITFLVLIINSYNSFGQEDFVAEVFNSINQESGRIEVQVIDVGPGNDQHAPPFTFQWESLEGNSMSIDNDIHLGTSNLSQLIPGTYCVTVTNLEGCDGNKCYDVENIDVILTEYPNPLTIPTMENSFSAEITNLVSGSNYTYQWQIQNLNRELLIPLEVENDVFTFSDVAELSDQIEFPEAYNEIIMHEESYLLALVFSEGVDLDLTDANQVDYSYSEMVEANTANIQSVEWPVCLGPTDDTKQFNVSLGGLPEGDYYYQLAANKDGNWITEDLPQGTLNSAGGGTIYQSFDISI